MFCKPLCCSSLWYFIICISCLRQRRLDIKVKISNFLIHFIKTASESSSNEFRRVSLQENVLRMKLHRRLRRSQSDVQQKGSAVIADLACSLFLCLICSYLLCHSALCTALHLKMTLVLREPCTPSEPDCKNTESAAENELCTRQ